MITKEDIISSIKYVVDNSQYVKINKEKINETIELLQKSEMEGWLDSNKLNLEGFSQKEIMIYLIICESLNFCYWESDIKWKIEYEGEWYSGSYGLFYAIIKAIKNGHNLLDLDYLNNLTIEELDDIFKGTTSIPLLKERYNVLKQLVNELEKIEDIEKEITGNDDIELLNSIINHFSNFRDISIYKDHKVYIFKRAILLVGDLINNVKDIKKCVKNDNNMVACADYKIPQVLRQCGVLEYSSDLANLVDNNQKIEHDSDMEIEIRANMIYAIELIRQRMNEMGIKKNSVQIDNALWLLSKNKEYKKNPYHLTRTIYY